MTTIAAVFDPRTSRAWIGADSHSELGGVSLPNTQKLTLVSPQLVIGFAGWALPRQWLRGEMREGELVEAARALRRAEEAHAVLVGLWDRWRAWARERGHGETAGGGAYLDPVMLAATPWALFIGDCYGQVARLDAEMPGFAIGSGERFAIGAMAALGDRGGAHRLERALEVAARFDPGTAGPFCVEVLLADRGSFEPEPGRALGEVADG
jgi:ATP-dependent protease HslVU (ClpYQ) peptidase subunit